MKTKTFLLLIIISLWSFKAEANHVHYYLSNTWDTEYLYFCGPMDSIIVHKPSAAVTGINWDAPIGSDISDVDSVIITSSLLGTWNFYSEEYIKDFYVFVITTSPTEPACMAHDTSFCGNFSMTLDAQNQNPGGHASTYAWSTGETSRIINVTTFGTYTVTVTGACGVGVYDINITQYNTNAPNLGTARNFCYGSSTAVLDPGNANITSYLWSTGATTPTITVDTTGSYWIHTIDNNGCEGWDTVQIMTPLPITDPGFVDTNICSISFSMTLDAQNPGYNYLWSTTETSQTISVNSPGIYSVTISETSCGINVYDITITQNNPNAPHLGNDQSFCYGSSAVLDPGNANVTSYLWSTGATTPTITVDTTDAYWVYTIDNNGCEGRDTIQVISLLPIGAEICYVEFDTATLKNSINWTSDLPTNADSVSIYKEDGINWVLIGTVYKNITYFFDMASNPMAQSYSYKIAIIDTCGNESDLSSYHKTITLLSAYDQPSNTYGFSWSFYEGLVVTHYYLYGIDASNNIHLVATLNGSDYMYNYVGPNPAYIKYYVGFETPNCDGTKANVVVKSNWIIKDPLITGIEEPALSPFTIFPNPATSQISISGIEPGGTLRLYDLSGKLLLELENRDNTLELDGIAAGSYVLECENKSGIVRGRVVVE